MFNIFRRGRVKICFREGKFENHVAGLVNFGLYAELEAKGAELRVEIDRTQLLQRNLQLAAKKDLPALGIKHHIESLYQFSFHVLRELLIDEGLRNQNARDTVLRSLREREIQ